MALELQDRMAIQELLNRYCHNADYHPPERMRELFTQDAGWEVPAMGLRFAGLEAIIAFFHSSREGDAGPSARHVISNVVIEGAGDKATSCAYLQVLSEHDARMQVVAFGRYFDELRRGADGAWRFAHRRVVIG